MSMMYDAIVELLRTKEGDEKMHIFIHYVEDVLDLEGDEIKKFAEDCGYPIASLVAPVGKEEFEQSER